MKAFKILGLVALLCVGFVVLAGMYKFNYLAGQPGYNVDGNRIDSIQQNTESSSVSEENLSIQQSVNILVYNSETQEDDFLEAYHEFSGALRGNKIEGVNFNLLFANAHVCSLADAEFVQNTDGVFEHVYFDYDDSIGKCTLGIALSDTELQFIDPENICAQYMCGARGSLDGFILKR